MGTRPLTGMSLPPLQADTDENWQCIRCAIEVSLHERRRSALAAAVQGPGGASEKAEVSVADVPVPAAEATRATLIVCPEALVFQWVSELRRHLDNVEVTSFSPAPASQPMAPATSASTNGSASASTSASIGEDGMELEAGGAGNREPRRKIRVLVYDGVKRFTEEGQRGRPEAFRMLRPEVLRTFDVVLTTFSVLQKVCVCLAFCPIECCASFACRMLAERKGC